jgi:protein licA homolog
MGDVHFDLAYFIESSNLTKDQEKVFFEAYGDDYEPKYLLIHRIIVNALIVL